MKNVLCVDLDGTFIKSDMLIESFTYCFFRNPIIIFYCLYWLFTGGKVSLKKNLFNAKINCQLNFEIDPTPISKIPNNSIDQRDLDSLINETYDLE